MRPGTLLVANLVQKTAVSQKAAGVARMVAEKTIVAVPHLVEPRGDAMVERRLGLGQRIGARGQARRAVRADPIADLRLREIVRQHHRAQLFFLRRRSDRHREASLFLHEVADRQRWVGGHQPPEKAHEKIIHARKNINCRHKRQISCRRVQSEKELN